MLFAQVLRLRTYNTMLVWDVFMLVLIRVDSIKIEKICVFRLFQKASIDQIGLRGRLDIIVVVFTLRKNNVVVAIVINCSLSTRV